MRWLNSAITECLFMWLCLYVSLWRTETQRRTGKFWEENKGIEKKKKTDLIVLFNETAVFYIEHCYTIHIYTFSSVQFSCLVMSDSATPWTAARQASLSIINFQSSPKPVSIESVMPSNHLTLCHPLLLLPSIFPSIRVFWNESALCISGQNIGISASTSILPINT